MILLKIENVNTNWICDDYDEDMIELGKILGIEKIIINQTY
jgi:hypothetical protein